MAGISTFQAAATLRSLSYRISSVSTKELPRTVSQAASSIWTCQDLLASPVKQQGDNAVLVNRYITQITTLLQDRSVEGRWSAIVLVKATIEAGGVEILSRSNAWVRSLLAILKKHNPPNTRCLAVLALTRIFILTWDYSSLVREITTPALPSFVATCLSNAENPRCSTKELQFILESLASLLPHHPTIFRTSDNQIRSLLTKIISSTASSGLPHYNTESISTARQVFALLPHCTPKQGGAEKWDEALQAAVKDAHQVCDRLFRAVIEDWKSKADVKPSVPSQQLLQGELILHDNGSLLGLKGWKGVFAGAERLSALLGIIETHFQASTPSTVQIRFGMLADLLDRLFSVAVPQPGKPNFTKPNPQIQKEEREALFAAMPQIHGAAVHLLLALLQRLGCVAVPIVPIFIDHVLSVFAAESATVHIRTAAYNVITFSLRLIGPTLSREEIAGLLPMISTACEDIVPANPRVSKRGTESQGNTTNLVLQADQTQQAHPTTVNDLEIAALNLLATSLSRLKSAGVPRKVRAQMDRTAVLSQSKDAMLASVLNPAPSSSGYGLQASLLPFLAKQYPSDPEVESLLRPRMPIVRTGSLRNDGDDKDGVSDDDLAMTDEEDQAEDEDHPFQIQPEENNDQSDLLSVLDKQINESAWTADENSSAAQRAPNKRPLLHMIDSGESSKRQRASPTTPALLPNEITQLPRPETLSVQNQLPVTVNAARVIEATPDVITLPQIPSPRVEASQRDMGQSDDDGSDFEIPPLTMEPDTEDEED